MRFQPYTEMLRRALSLEENTVLKHPLKLFYQTCPKISYNRSEEIFGYPF
ncbi:hypothetical protein NIES4072_35630 [Nostoc commune NIES-4072]|uniref:Uncharacterized protein n=1 Tax=Nostoc commune NIES-4072 TaxID=2005467 RepID=A0A2R5FW59_NOSCO|nr:hypothetical protein NIES4070_55160 [Nostoc commune HK-02]GBG19894.1 hypothetical protein NIES4072_35630 [Nostoc commune NIES-4072]